jgi:hypothetical protein
MPNRVQHAEEQCADYFFLPVCGRKRCALSSRLACNCPMLCVYLTCANFNPTIAGCQYSIAMNTFTLPVERLNRSIVPAVDSALTLTSTHNHVQTRTVN